MNVNQNDSIAASTSTTLRIPTEKIALLQNLLRLLDALIFLQLGVLYLQDNLTLFLILRAVSQSLHNPPALQLAPVLLINFLCFTAHLLQARPEATGWASRGYLHGGLIIDFVGELGPVSKWRLISMDLLILGLQLVALVVGNEKQKASGDPEAQDPPEAEDLEAAEEGRVRPQASTPVETEEGIEMQSLLPEGSSQVNSNGGKSTAKAQEDDILELDMRRGLRSLLRRSRTAAATTSADTATNSAGIADFLSRVADARARAA